MWKKECDSGQGPESFFQRKAGQAHVGIGVILVEVCDRNAILKADLEALEEKYPEVAVLETNCLNMCNMCRARPFALVNGQRIYAKTAEDCIKEIEQLIEKELASFYESES